METRGYLRTESQMSQAETAEKVQPAPAAPAAPAVPEEEAFEVDFNSQAAFAAFNAQVGGETYLLKCFWDDFRNLGRYSMMILWCFWRACFLGVAPAMWANLHISAPKCLSEVKMP